MSAPKGTPFVSGLFIGSIVFGCGLLLVSIISPQDRPAFQEDIATATKACSIFGGLNSVYTTEAKGMVVLHISCNNGNTLWLK